MARKANPEVERPRYFYEFVGPDGVLRTVEAHTFDQAFRHLYAPDIKYRRLTTGDAVKLYRSGAEVICAIPVADPNQEPLPLAQGDDGAPPAEGSAPEAISDEATAQASSTPEQTNTPNRGRFGRKTG